MGINFIVDLESGNQYEVNADYEIHHIYNSIGCSLIINSIKPINDFDTPISDQLITEIESALAYKIIDIYNDLDTDEDMEGYLC